ncbi:unnamed protein product [Calypogeia fissa]
MASRGVSALQVLFPFLVVLFLISGHGVSAGITCQTSGASPSAVDANGCATFLVNKGNTDCCQNDCASSNACTQMCSDGTAASAICGVCGQCVTCQAAGNYLGSLIENCQSNGQVGGYINGFGNSLLVEVYHT